LQTLNRARSVARMSGMQPRSYVVQCRPHQEQRAYENLSRQGFSCYLPKIRTIRLRQGRRLEREEPLFPGYLFISLDSINDNWQPVRSTRGVVQIVRFNEHPVPVSEEIIEMIRTRSATERRSRCLQQGERVRIIEGAFQDIEAIFMANDGVERVVLLMAILHRTQTVSFPVTSVREITAASSDRAARSTAHP
jgi:transcriptional antiterminator RfaH